MKKISVDILRPRRAPVRLLMLALSGALAGLCITFPTYVGAFLQWLVYVPAAWVLYAMSGDDTGTARRFLRSWCYGFLFFMSEYLVVYHWFFAFYPLDFTGMSRASAAVVVMVAWVGLSLLASLAGGFVFVLFVLAARGKAAKRLPWLMPFTGGALFALFEWVETIGWMGVPWGRAALGQLAFDSSLTVQSASLLGSYFVTFLIVSVSFLMAQAALSERRVAVARTCTALVLVLSNLLYGAEAFCFGSEGTEIRTAAIQGNVSSREKWTLTVNDTVELYKGLICEAAEAGAELIVCPESAFPWDMTHDSGSLDTFGSIAREYGVSIIIGCLDGRGEGQQNVLILICPNGSVSDTFYSKRHLVPFGEYMPWRDFLSVLIPPLAEIAMLEYDIVAGSSPAVMTLADGTCVGGLICFDSIYETLALESAREGAQILALGTNDSWFLDSAAVYMHNEQARLRAIETGLPVVRAANTGISSLIDSKGRVKGSLPPLEDGVLCGTLTTGSASFYCCIGNLFVYLLIAFYFSQLAYGVAVSLLEKRRGLRKSCDT